MTVASAVDIQLLQSWVGRERVRIDDLNPFKAQALAAALDRPDLPGAGDVLPPTWQWLYFLDTPRASETNLDGHPKNSTFLPPTTLPGRMWAGGKFQCLQPLLLGQTAEQRSVIRSIELKEGKSGPLLFLLVEHGIYQHNELCLLEEQTIVYRELPAAPAPLPAGNTAPEDTDWQMTITPDPVLLFRYSALTYNSHRIHYDRDYAMNKEFYPALIMHGPLLATWLAELAAINLPAARLEFFQFRAIRPTFDTTPFTVCGKQEGDRILLWTRDHEGFVGMSASAGLGKSS